MFLSGMFKEIRLCPLLGRKSWMMKPKRPLSVDQSFKHYSELRLISE